MQYVCSDLHGVSLEDFKTMLEETGFTDSDFLWVLGDVIDRGPDGINILKWIMEKHNIRLILGNHEKMLLDCDFLHEEITERSVAGLTESKLSAYVEWISNGGRPTLKALSAMNKSEIHNLLEYLRNAPIYQKVNLNGKDYILTHSGLGSFRKDKDLSEYSSGELLWNRPGLNDEYYGNSTVIFGHTPTLYYGEEFKGKAIKTSTWINIDMGASFGVNPMLLRLDDLKEFYFDERMKIIG